LTFADQLVGNFPDNSQNIQFFNKFCTFITSSPRQNPL
jgi:hypothetical protein